VIAKDELLRTLPLRQGVLLVRAWTRQDVDRLAAWPPYPFPYQGFEFSFAGASRTERDALYRDRQARRDVLVLVVDRQAQPAVGYLGLRCVDWQAGTVGKFGVRVHPDWCERGVGTSIIRAVTRWSFEHGFVSWRLDVAASNARAVRCYEKAGFVQMGELWRRAGNLVDLSEPRYDFVRPHLREQGGRIELRFWVMELKGEINVQVEEAL
jgi:RimJ/RimL family protein N-acetyltransferase